VSASGPVIISSGRGQIASITAYESYGAIWSTLRITGADGSDRLGAVLALRGEGDVATEGTDTQGADALGVDVVAGAQVGDGRLDVLGPLEWKPRPRDSPSLSPP
jgi:hypothetical protein